MPVRHLKTSISAGDTAVAAMALGTEPVKPMNAWARAIGSPDRRVVRGDSSSAGTVTGP